MERQTHRHERINLREQRGLGGDRGLRCDRAGVERHLYGRRSHPNHRQPCPPRSHLDLQLHRRLRHRPQRCQQEVVGNYVHDNGLYPTACGYVHGIYFLDVGGIAYNNLSFRNAGWDIHLWHGASHLVITSNTLFNNLHGAIVVGNDIAGADYCVVNNNIDYNNARGIFEEGTTGTHNVYRNNLVCQNPPADISLQNGLSATGTVSADPLFVNCTGDSSGDYPLRSNSPAIDGGTNDRTPTKDYAGTARPQGSAWDIGAFEYVFSSASAVARGR